MKKWSIALTGLLLAATLAGCGSQKVIATTNGGNITEPAYYSSLKETPSGQQVLQQMILSKVLEKQYGDKVSQAAVNQLFNQTKAQYGSSFNRVLSQGGLPNQVINRIFVLDYCSKRPLRRILKLRMPSSKSNSNIMNRKLRLPIF